MEIAIPLYEKYTALDAVGPYQVLSTVPGWRVRFTAREAGPLEADNRMLTLVAEGAWEDVPSPDVIVVPGGMGTRQHLEDERLLGWLRSAHQTSKWTTSVCTGSLLLAAAGLLDGKEATSHWCAYDSLEGLGARPTARRVVRDGRLITAAGVSSGIDMALRLVELELGPEMSQAVQLGIEYDPQPPHDAGSPDKAPAEIVELVRETMRVQEEAALVDLPVPG